MTPPKHLTPGDFIQVPSEPFVYILNAKMGNRITFLIQPGRDDQDERTQVDELAATARFLAASKTMAEALDWIVSNPGAHRNNIRNVCKAALLQAGYTD